MKKTLAQLQAEHKAITDKMDALLAKAEADGDRELTAEEAAEFAQLEADAAKLHGKMVKRQALATHQQIATTPSPRITEPAQPSTLHTHLEAPAATIPAQYRTHGQLKSFKGPDGGRLAYRFGAFVLAVSGNRAAERWCLQNGVALSQVGDAAQSLAMSEGSNIFGGNLVQDEFMPTIIELMEKYGVFRQNADIVPMGSDTKEQPRRVSGLTMYYVGENTAGTASDAKWDRVRLTAKKGMVLAQYSSELNEDSLISFGDKMADEIGLAFALGEDQAGFNGDGTSTYGGIWGITQKINDGTHTAGVVDAASTHTGFETLTLSDFNKVTGALPQYAKMRGNCAWYFSGAGYANSAERLMYAAGGNTSKEVGGKVMPMFLGYPVVISQVLFATLGAQVSKIVALFGDLKLSSMLGDRRKISIKLSEEHGFDTDSIWIRGTERFDINNHSLGDNSTPGPIVALKTAAS